MAKMTGLGKGLDALFGGAPIEQSVEEKEEIIESSENLKSLKITEVEPNRDQPRKTFNQESLEELAKGRTTLVIAHRLSTIRNAKCICVVSEEGIVEAGTHEELLKDNETYRSIYETQTKGGKK